MLPNDHPKARVVHQVYGDLVRAIGDGRTPPVLQLAAGSTAGGLQVTWYAPANHTLCLEDRAYDVCTSLGADSLAGLAVLLGHELAHFYKDHGWVGDFGNGFSDPGVGQQVGVRKWEEERLLEVEEEADYFGEFFGYMAGYNTVEVAPELLVRLYKEYGLEEEVGGYPGLGVRQEIARQVGRKLAGVLPVYEVGVRLLLVGRYDEASRCFGHVGREFPSREVLNNGGVCKVLAALSLGRLERFAYPCEIDPSSRLRAFRRGDEVVADEAQEERREFLLEEARALFDQARSRDPGYGPAYVNLSCTASLGGQYGEGVVWAERGMELGRKSGERSVVSDGLVARGIARAGLGDVEGAQRDFGEALSHHSSLAQLNIQALGRIVPIVHPAGPGEKVALQRELIEGRSARDSRDLVTAPDEIATLPRLDQNQPAFTIYSGRREASRWWVVDTGRATITFLETRRPYREQTDRGLRIGQLLAQVTEAYGAPTRLIAGRLGTYQVYERAGIVFHLEAGGKVQGWMLYSIEE